LQPLSTILNEIRNGNELAFRKLFDLYYQKLLHTAIYFLKSKSLAEEAISDVFFIMWKKREHIIHIENIENYLYIAVKNQCLHYIRRSVTESNDSFELYEIEYISDEQDPEKKLLEKEYTESIQRAINSLPEKCREVFRLVYGEKLKHKQIAEILNISEKTVEAHVSTAYKKIALFVKSSYK
jgi:RNA polymerase sigma-70 factor (ECF subfamily)